MGRAGQSIQNGSPTSRPARRRTKHDLERLAAVAEKIRGIAVTYHTVTRQDALAMFPKLEIGRLLRRRL